MDRRTADALIEMMFLAAYADDELAEAERKELSDNVAALTNNTVVGADFDAVMLHVGRMLAAEGRAARLASLATRIPDPQMRRDAFAAAVRMVAADGIVRTSERELLLEVADALSIDGNTAADMVNELTRHLR